MTKPQIKKQLSKAGKSVQSAQLDRYLKRFNILPAGIRQRPQQYPDDTAERILKHLGIFQVPQYTMADAFPVKKLSGLQGRVRGTPVAHNDVQRGSTPRPATKIVSMKKLKAERSKVR